MPSLNPRSLHGRVGRANSSLQQEGKDDHLSNKLLREEK